MCAASYIPCAHKIFRSIGKGDAGMFICQLQSDLSISGMYIYNWDCFLWSYSSYGFFLDFIIILMNFCRVFAWWQHFAIKSWAQMGGALPYFETIWSVRILLVKDWLCTLMPIKYFISGWWGIACLCMKCSDLLVSDRVCTVMPIKCFGSVFFPLTSS